ncbi:MAG: DUF2130 domain-containing protein [Bryobacteraceae bacterium]
MIEPTIPCPQCKTQIKLTESLAAPLVEATRREYERKMQQNSLECAKREEEVRQQEQAFLKKKEEWRAAEQERLRQERTRIAEEEARRAEQKFSTDLGQKLQEIAHLEQVLKSRDAKLMEAQKTQAECLQKERALEDERRELEVTVEKRVQEGLSVVRTQARQEAEEQLKLKIFEKELTISSMQKQIEDLRRRAEQGSQQLQGEAQELELENMLATKFPFDSILPIRKGEYGGDVLQRVTSSNGQPCGSILWESKRTKHWSDGWLVKLREDQRNAKAEIAVIVSQTLPREVDSFELVEGVWVTHPRTMIPVAFVLRHTLIEVESTRRVSEGQQSKAEMIYQYLVGPRFRQRVQAIVEAFGSMQEDLDKEKRAIMKQWAKREEQLQRAMQATVGMYGDLQGIAGKTMQEIQGLDMDAFDLDQLPAVRQIAFTSN